VLVEDGWIPIEWTRRAGGGEPSATQMQLESTHFQTVAEWAEASTEWFGRRFRMQELDRAADGIASGILTVPVLTFSRPASLE